MNRSLKLVSNNSYKQDDGLPADDELSIDVYDQPGHLIRRAHQIAVSMFHRTIGYEVTPIQYAVLRILQDHPGIDQVTLARYCALDTSTAADLAVRLEERGLVKRMMPMKSRRFRVLHLTDEGVVLLKKFVHLNNAKSRAPLDRSRTDPQANPSTRAETRQSHRRKQA